MSEDYNVKLDRCHYFEREWITRDIKKAVAKKTDNRCAMCGKHIEVGDKDFTVDHFIPLNKGGNNDIKNLIPLCYDCNQEKTDDVITVYGKVPYLKSKHKKELMEITQRFMNSYIWLTDNNILAFDNEIVDLHVPIPQKLARKKGDIMYKVPLTIRKAKELKDDTKQFIINYNSHYGLETSYIGEQAQYYIDRGYLYEVRKHSDNKLIAVFYFDIDNITLYCKGEKLPSKVIEISNIICDPSHTSIIEGTRATLVNFLICDILNSCKSLGMETLDIAIQYCTLEEKYDLYRENVERYTCKNYSEDYEMSNVFDKGNGFESRLYFCHTGLLKGKTSELTDDDWDELAYKNRLIMNKQLGLCTRS